MNNTLTDPDICMDPLIKTATPTPGGSKITLLVAQARNGHIVYSKREINDTKIATVVMDIRVLDGDYWQNIDKRMYLQITTGSASTIPVEVMITCFVILLDGRILPCMNEIRDFYDAGWSWLTMPPNN